MPPAIRVLIADDQALFAEGLRYVLASTVNDIEVVGLAADGEAALTLTEEHKPDIVLMDVRMPRMDGVEATKLINTLYQGVKVVMLTTFDDDEYVHQAIRFGAVGYLLKNMRPEELVLSLRAVMSGATLFARGVTAKVVRNSRHVSGEIEQIVAGLTKREKEILGLVMQMQSNKDVAERLKLSEQTVRNYISSLYHAFGVTNRMELIRKLQGDRNLHPAP